MRTDDLHSPLYLPDLLANALNPIVGQKVIVENRSGGGGLIGTKQAIAAPGDGHTLLMAATSAIMSLAVNTPSPFEISRGDRIAHHRV